MTSDRFLAGVLVGFIIGMIVAALIILVIDYTLGAAACEALQKDVGRELQFTASYGCQLEGWKP
jgi:hypothetical protein